MESCGFQPARHRRQDLDARRREGSERYAHHVHLQSLPLCEGRDRPNARRDCRELERHGIKSVAIMSNDTERYQDDNFDNMKRFAAEHALPFPYLLDETQSVARAYDAICTPDFFGFNADLGLQYRGRLDASKVQPVPNAQREMFDAMVRIAATGQGPAEHIPSMGCSIKWK